MSTESETKSEGVPAGATHVCLLCGQYWMLAWQMVGGESDPDCGCEDDLRSIAKAGPAPTTAAPAEQPACVNPYHLKSGDHNGKTCYSVKEPMPPGDRARALISAAPAEQLSGKRTGFSNIDKPFADLIAPAEQPGKAADPRPAEPQAPAEPTQEQIEKATAVVANLWGPKSLHVALVGKIAAALAAEAAPLREERDRLAGKVRELNARVRKDGEYRERAGTGLRAQVAERDARIATLTQALGREIEAAREFVANAAKWNEKGDPRAARAGLALAEQSLAKAAAALGAPEGQPPAPQRYLGNDVTCSDATSSPEEQLSGKELK